MLKKGLRLRKKEDFDRVFRSSKPLFFNGIGCRYIQGGKTLRVGFSFSKKHIPLAVERNRLRRVLSEAIAQLRNKDENGLDIVFFTTKKPQKLTLTEGLTIIQSVFHQSKITKN